jgi:hypothetical protein
MMYEIRYESNGREGKMNVRAETDAEALRRFDENWSADGDAPPASRWIVGRWAETN